MNTVPHTVVPERIMALLDGELSAAEAGVISTHLDTCTECAQIAERLRSTSEQLSAWKAPEIPAKVEKSVAELVEKMTSGHRAGHAAVPLGPSRWTWGRWAILGAGAVAVLLLALTMTLPFRQRSFQYRVGEAVYDGRLAQAPVPPAPSAAQRQGLPLNGRVTLSSPGVAGVSNGLYHGLGDHAADEFSVNGQLQIDRESKTAASAIPAPMIARTVSLLIVVKDFAASRSSLDAILARHHGYPAQLGVNTPENAPRSLGASLRVPAPELASAVGDLKTLGRVENESQTGEDVTRQHVDLAIRLKNARETELRFRAILQQYTGKVVEVLQVEENIARVRSDIERMEAEQSALEHRVDFATIDLQLTEEYKAPLNPPGASVSTRLHNAFVAGYHNAAEMALGIVLFFGEYGPVILIWLLIFLLPVVLLARRYRRKAAAF